MIQSLRQRQDNNIETISKEVYEIVCSNYMKAKNKPIINPPIKIVGGGNGLLRDDSIFDSREERDRFDVFFDDSRKEF
jgi:hypothetical protein